MSKQLPGRQLEAARVARRPGVHQPRGAQLFEESVGEAAVLCLDRELSRERGDLTDGLLHGD